MSAAQNFLTGSGADRGFATGMGGAGFGGGQSYSGQAVNPMSRPFTNGAPENIHIMRPNPRANDTHWSSQVLQLSLDMAIAPQLVSRVMPMRPVSNLIQYGTVTVYEQPALEEAALGTQPHMTQHESYDLEWSLRRFSLGSPFSATTLGTAAAQEMLSHQAKQLVQGIFNIMERLILTALVNANKHIDAMILSLNPDDEDVLSANLDVAAAMFGCLNRDPRKFGTFIERVRPMVRRYGADLNLLLMPSNLAQIVGEATAYDNYSESGNRRSIEKGTHVPKSISGCEILSYVASGKASDNLPVRPLDRVVTVGDFAVMGFDESDERSLQTANRSIWMPNSTSGSMSKVYLSDVLSCKGLYWEDKVAGQATLMGQTTDYFMSRATMGAVNDAIGDGFAIQGEHPTHKLVMELFDSGLALPVSIVLSRPFIQLATQSVVAVAGGEDLGSLLFALPHMAKGLDVGSKLGINHYSVHLAAALKTAWYVAIFPDVYVKSYKGGRSTDVIDLYADGEKGDLEHHVQTLGQSVVPYVLPKETQERKVPRVFDIFAGGRYGPSKSESTFETDKQWRERFGLVSSYMPMSLTREFNSTEFNSICYKCDYEKIDSGVVRRVHSDGLLSHFDYPTGMNKGIAGPNRSIMMHS